MQGSYIVCIRALVSDGMKPTNYGMGGGGDEQIQTKFLLSM